MVETTAPSCPSAAAMLSPEETAGGVAEVFGALRAFWQEQRRKCGPEKAAGVMTLEQREAALSLLEREAAGGVRRNQAASILKEIQSALEGGCVAAADPSADPAGAQGWPARAELSAKSDDPQVIFEKVHLRFKTLRREGKIEDAKRLLAGDYLRLLADFMNEFVSVRPVFRRKAEEVLTGLGVEGARRKEAEVVVQDLGASPGESAAPTSPTASPTLPTAAPPSPVATPLRRHSAPEQKSAETPPPTSVPSAPRRAADPGFPRLPDPERPGGFGPPREHKSGSNFGQDLGSSGPRIDPDRPGGFGPSRSALPAVPTC